MQKYQIIDELLNIIKDFDFGTEVYLTI